MYPARSALIRFPFATYAVLACGFGWMFIIAHRLGAGPGAGQFPLGPLMAALIVTAGLGRSGFRTWGRHLAAVRAAPGWYLLALVAPIAILAAAVLVNGLFGAPVPTAAQLAGWSTLGPVALSTFIAIGIGEEAGWTAFAAPWLLERRSFLSAWILLASVRVVWHLPLLWSGDLSLPLGVGGNFAFQFLVLWMMRRTGVWWLAAIWHTVLNVVGGQFLFRMVEGADQGRLGLLMVAGYVVFAAAVYVGTRGRLDGPAGATTSSTG